jgi:stearoyl-CoA desaturase (Delta-9 desaturase)
MTAQPRLSEAARDHGDVQQVAHELRDRIVTATVTVVPLLALGVAAWRTWEGLLRPSDVVVFAVLYVLTGLGVTVGFHRLFTHRSFKAGPAVRDGSPSSARAACGGSVAVRRAGDRHGHR